MPLRDGKTPNAQQLASLAEISASDIDSAARGFRRNVAAQRAPLRFLLDAGTDGKIGDASGPIPDEG
jgi:hypothetical protein